MNNDLVKAKIGISSSTSSVWKDVFYILRKKIKIIQSYMISFSSCAGDSALFDSVEDRSRLD